MTRPPALVLVNPAAAGGRAARRWRAVEPSALEHVSAELVELGPDTAWERRVERALRAGTRVFIAAGGDGTVHTLVNALYFAQHRPSLSELTLGAVGLGSSNDYHKGRSRKVSGVFLRTDPERRVPRDVCLVRFHSGDGALAERCFCVSASVGMTATGNAFFNSTDPIVAWLKRGSADLAIAYAALRTWATLKPLTLRLVVGGETLSWSAATLNIQKTPYVSGLFHLDTPAAADDRLLGVNVCTLTSRAALLWRMVGLLRGRFRGQPGCHFWHVPRLEVEVDAPVALELDGEIYSADTLTCEVVGEAIGECT